jgi:hypothetical protein
MPSKILINRVPVMTLWKAVVAQRLGFNWKEALSLGKAVAGLNAQSKGKRRGIFKPHEQKAKAARATLYSDAENQAVETKTCGWPETLLRVSTSSDRAPSIRRPNGMNWP